MSEHKTSSHELNHRSRRAIIVGIQTPQQSDQEVRSSCVELERLANTLGITVVDTEIQQRKTAATSTFVGSGKLEALARLTGGPGEVSKHRESDPDAEEQAYDDLPDPIADLVVVDAELEPRQHRALELALDAEVLDRTALILEIFETRAQTKAARLEVEIARLQYELPRLRDDATKQSRRGGGGRGGRGHTNVELGKQRIRDRIAELEEELADAQATESSRRENREQTFRVALVGYTNAGKSSLLHGLTESEVLVEDKLFATLGTTVRKLCPPTTPTILLSDTVGFIKNLPHELVASFQSTLDEAVDAQLILNVVDASDPDWRDQLRVTRQTLESIGAADIATHLIFNKVDCLDQQTRQRLADEFPGATQMSALRTGDLQNLRETLIAARDRALCEETVMVPFSEGHLLSEIYDHARVVDEQHSKEGTILRMRARAASLDRWRSMLDEPAPIESVDDLLETAQTYGLEVISTADSFDDTDLDFRVVFAEDEHQDLWVLRTPRRPDVFASSRVEGRVLRLVESRLPTAVPDWKLHTPQLIAYPKLAGEAAWTINADDSVTWNHIDPKNPSPSFMISLAEMLAALQSVTANEAISADIPLQSIDKLRTKRRQMMTDTRDVLSPDEAVWQRWNRWLEDDEIWPDHTVLTHGDFHPGHMLVDQSGRLTGVLHWTEAKIGDPGTDLAVLSGCFGRSAMETFVEYFDEAGGRTWPNLVDHVCELWAFQPVQAASWALETNNDAVIEQARRQLGDITARETEVK